MATIDADLVKATEAARSTGLSKYFLYRLAAKGKIPFYRAGKALRFSVRELREWMKAQAQRNEF